MLSGLGTTGGDSGTTRRVIGSFLTWLNDRKADVYVITANDLSEIAQATSEMLRKGAGTTFGGRYSPDEETRKRFSKFISRKYQKNGLKKMFGMLSQI